MPPTHVLNVDLGKIYVREGEDYRYRTTVAWGDPLEVKDVEADRVVLRATTMYTEPDGSPRWEEVDGYLRAPRGMTGDDLVRGIDDSEVLKVDFVDVQQGDAAVIETPSGRVVLVDGGDNQLFARYLANRFKHSSEAEPREVAAIVITHGDADHFSGLTEIYRSESNSEAYKRLFLHPERVFHNGLVKRPSDRRDVELLGDVVEGDGVTIVTSLHDDLLEVPDEEMNRPFKEWKEALQAWAARGDITFRRIDGDATDAFDFLNDDGIEVDVLGPSLTEVDGARGLRFLGTPRDDAELREQPVRPGRFVGRSASHTINGHSIIFRLNYGAARFLFAGDLNEEAEEDLVARHAAGDVDLTSEVLKVPHHGSADFSRGFLESAGAVISVVSSGDESSLKEYIHPRAPLVGALGRYARKGVAEPVIFVTEMVAFFEAIGWTDPEFHKLRQGAAYVDDAGIVVLDAKAAQRFFAFKRSAFGIVKVRTDGKRLLVWTNSGSVALKEAYALDLESDPPRRVNLKRV